MQMPMAHPDLLQGATEKRDTRRRRVISFGLVVPDEKHPGLDCTIRDLSEDGARISFARNVTLPERFWLIDVRERTAFDVKLAWRIDLEAALTFRRSIALSRIADPQLVFLKILWLKHATR